MIAMSTTSTCNTVTGAGQDLRSVGTAVDIEAEEATDGNSNTKSIQRKDYDNDEQ